LANDFGINFQKTRIVLLPTEKAVTFGGGIRGTETYIHKLSIIEIALLHYDVTIHQNSVWFNARNRRRLARTKQRKFTETEIVLKKPEKWNSFQTPLILLSTYEHTL